ncbi:unnamed protein product [Ixodes pacificus]
MRWYVYIILCKLIFRSCKVCKVMSFCRVVFFFFICFAHATVIAALLYRICRPNKCAVLNAYRLTQINVFFFSFTAKQKPARMVLCWCCHLWGSVDMMR